MHRVTTFIAAGIVSTFGIGGPPQARQVPAAIGTDPAPDKDRGDAIGRLNGLIGTGNGKAATAPEDIVKAARDGRVERLFLLPGRPVWGQLLDDEDRIVARDEKAEDDDDLLNYAAVMTLRQGGDVTMVEPAQLPPPGPAAAILRY